MSKLTETEKVLKFLKDYKSMSPLNKEIVKSIVDDKLKPKLNSLKKVRK